MSAAPKLDPVEPAAAPEPVAVASDADGFALLEALRRKLDDQASQGRKTQQQVTQLAESIGSLVEVQRRRSRSLNLNSFVAYVIFTVLCGAGSMLLYRSRASELGAARARAEAERDVATKRAAASDEQLAARAAAEAGAWSVYELLENGKRADAVATLTALAAAPLSRTERAVLAARAHATAVQAVDTALTAATSAFKAGRHGDVIAPLEAALAADPKGPRTPAVHYFLGVAYAKAGQLPRAVPHLQAAVDDTEHADARFQLASALDRSGAYAAARTEYDRFATAQPQSPFAAFAMRRSATLARMPARRLGGPAVAPAVAKPASPPAPAPAAVTPPGTPGVDLGAAATPARPGE